MNEFETPLEIIHDDNDFCVVYKPSGILSQSGVDANSSNLSQLAEDHFKRKLHLFTRLDRPVSGICLFSKSSRFNKHFHELQSESKISKKYIAIVEGKLEEKSFELTHYHFHNKANKKAIIRSEIQANFKPVTLNVDVLKVLDRYTVMSVELKSGKFHQIRSQLSHIGHPIKGDVKYGARRSNRDRSLHLNAIAMNFVDLKGNTLNIKGHLPKNDNLWNLVEEIMTNS